MSITKKNYFSEILPTKSSRKRRKRLDTKRLLKKKAVESGAERITKSGRQIKQKKFSLQTICRCDKGCAQKIDALRQKQIFDSYYGCSWANKTALIRSSVKRKPIKKEKINSKPCTTAKKQTVFSNFFSDWHKRRWTRSM